MKTGALIDIRSDKEKAKDFSTFEIGSSSEVKYVTKARALKSIKTIRDQKSTSSCGAHAGELAVSHLGGSEYSQAKIYRNRQNYPGEGMYIKDITDIVTDLGVAQADTVKKTEQAYNAVSKDFVKVFNTSGYTLDYSPTFDELARVSNVLKLPQIILLFSKNGKEYGKTRPVADKTFTDSSSALIRHFVVIPPNSAFVDKKEHFLMIQDSSGFGDVFVREFSRDWVEKRVLASTSLYVSAPSSPSKLRHKGYIFSRDLTVGSIGTDVKVLQETLQDFGFLPSTLVCTSYFGGMTLNAVKQFQKKYEESILWKVGLKLPTGYFGTQTRRKIQELLT